MKTKLNTTDNNFKNKSKEVSLRFENFTKEDALHYVSESGSYLKDLGQYKDDEDVVLKACTGNYQALKHASSKIRKNKKFLTTMLEQGIKADILFYVHENLKSDKEFVLPFLKRDGNLLSFVSKSLQDDLETVLTAVKQSGTSLGDASERLQNDETVFMQAIQQDPYAYTYGSDSLQEDDEFLYFIYRKSVLDYFGLIKLDYIKYDVKNKFEKYLKIIPDDQDFLIKQFKKSDEALITLKRNLAENDVAIPENFDDIIGPATSHLLNKMNRESLSIVKSENIEIKSLILKTLARANILNVDMNIKNKKKNRLMKI